MSRKEFDFSRIAAIIRAMKWAVCQIGLVFVMAMSGCGDDFIEPGHPTADEAFRSLLVDPVPASIKDLQGSGDTWQGYSIYLRFKATDELIKTLVTQGYHPAKWDEMKSRFELPSEFKSIFKPDWAPESISTKECYEMDNVKNGWTHQGTHYLVLDRASGTVYFYGIGA